MHLFVVYDCRLPLSKTASTTIPINEAMTIAISVAVTPIKDDNGTVNNVSSG